MDLILIYFLFAQTKEEEEVQECEGVCVCVRETNSIAAVFK